LKRQAKKKKTVNFKQECVAQLEKLAGTLEALLQNLDFQEKYE